MEIKEFIDDWPFPYFIEDRKNIYCVDGKMLYIKEIPTYQETRLAPPTYKELQFARSLMDSRWITDYLNEEIIIQAFEIGWWEGVAYVLLNVFVKNDFLLLKTDSMTILEDLCFIATRLPVEATLIQIKKGRGKINLHLI